MSEHKEQVPEDYTEWVKKTNAKNSMNAGLLGSGLFGNAQVNSTGIIYGGPYIGVPGDGLTIKPVETSVPKYHYNEPAIIAEIKSYIDRTYSAHYSNNIQTLEFIMDHCENFDYLKGNVFKYVDRYGKKDGYNRNDLLKAMHYIIFMLHYDQKKKTDDQTI